MSLFSVRLAELRKQRNMSLRQIAKELDLSPQTVANWIKGEHEPSMSVIIKLADLFDVSASFLLEPAYSTQYEEKYRQSGFYWGEKVNDLAYETLKYMPATRPVHLLDVGCGEGQAAVFFARFGYHVSAFDIAETGLVKGRKLAEAAGVKVNFFQADLLDYYFIDTFDIVYSTDVLEYIPPQERKRVIGHFQEFTRPGGIHVLDTFVEKPFIPTPPDWEHGKEFFWETGELFAYYKDWKIELIKESIINCNSAGIPHTHCMDVLIARKMETDKNRLL